MEKFSLVSKAMDDFSREVEDAAFQKPAEAFNEKERTESARLARVIKAEKSFWEFDKMYFPPDMHKNYSKPFAMHKDMFADLHSGGGVFVIAGARKHAKTAYAKKMFVYDLLTGNATFIGTLSETLLKSRNILSDIVELIFDNPRIMFDYRPEIIEKNADQFSFRVFATKEHSKHTRRGMCFSEDRSVRGAVKLFGRPQKILCDDLETRMSPMGKDHVEARIRVLAEAFQSCEDNGVLLALCNLFDERCAMYRLKKEQDLSILPSNWKVRIYPAWDAPKNRPAWKSAFPVSTEQELREILKPYDSAEWESEFQQNPTPPEGIIFRREYYQEYTELPSDARGVAYCDPNLSEKGLGDTTALGGLLYSQSTGKYYIHKPRCRSYNSSNKLLADFLNVRDDRVRRLGFDGHVNQQSTWKNNVRNYCQIQGLPMPSIFYCRYHVDELAKNVQLQYEQGNLLFPAEWVSAQEKETALKQFFSFAGKKANKKDDFPDFLICAFEFISEQRLVRRGRIDGAVLPPDLTLTDVYSF